MSAPPHKPSFRLKTGHTLVEAILIAKELTQKGQYQIGKPELPNELAELGYFEEEGMVTALMMALDEITPENYRPVGEPHPIPGVPFVWSSKCFGRGMYLKFKIMGTKRKPTLVWYSCHPETDYKL